MFTPETPMVPIITVLGDFYTETLRAAGGTGATPTDVAIVLAKHDGGRSSDVMAFLINITPTYADVINQGFPAWTVTVDDADYLLQYAQAGPAYSLYRAVLPHTPEEAAAFDAANAAAAANTTPIEESHD